MTETNTTDINIRASADRVITLLEQHRTREAMQLLDTERQGERLAVQEALDRYVAAGARTQLTALQRPGAMPAADTEFVGPALQRLQAAHGEPRLPVVDVGADGNARGGGTNELDGLSAAQSYDIYASMVAVRGTQASRDALERGDRVILGLRQENSTLATMDDARTRTDESRNPSGKGVYDDRLVVLWKDANGAGHLHQALRANTEPTAIYDHHAGSNGRRLYADGGIDQHQRAASPGYEGVRSVRKIEGDDVNGDGLRDLGRMAEGTYEMEGARHAWPGRPGVTSFSLRPTLAAVRDGQQQVERDSNADGYFTATDVNGPHPLNQSFKIHLGSRGSTDSAGCQTIHVDDGEAFLAAVRGTPGQTRWQYVLTSTTPGAVRDVQLDLPPLPGHRQPQLREDMPQRHGPPPVLGDRFPTARADTPMFEAIQRQLPAGTSDAQTAHVMAQAKVNGIQHVHQLDKVAVQDGQAWVVGRTPGFWAKVDLSAPVPPLEESLRVADASSAQERQASQQQVSSSNPAMRMGSSVCIAAMLAAALLTSHPVPMLPIVG